ncbi:MAG: hypothetical protein RBS39_09665 [Phycisphaerales bacterium]|nr:hypothetical protein [Phycisphaerales bacterium]
MPTGSFLDKHHFLLRRLHSLTGIVPVGVFLIPHLTTNSSILWGRLNARADAYADNAAMRGVVTFQEDVHFINGLPALLLIEITLWAAIAFHSILGVMYARSGKANVQRYAYQDNWRYTLQRISGYVGIFFIFYHIATLRWGWSFLVPGGTKWSHEFAASTLAACLQGSTEGMTPAGVLISLWYFVGVTLLVFHFANGLWTAAITWGLTISESAQKRWGYVCSAIGAGLMLAAWSSVIGFVTLSHDDARAHELRLIEGHTQPAESAPAHAGVPATNDHGG